MDQGGQFLRTCSLLRSAFSGQSIPCRLLATLFTAASSEKTDVSTMIKHGEQKLIVHKEKRIIGVEQSSFPI
ncbi:hypothetical protein QG37_02888 [Candidozyma auris]|nr:hypothetical protein QG37_02888 [[Candida] auris]